MAMSEEENVNHALQVLITSISLAYKWQKVDLTNRIETWVKDFTESMTDQEKVEYRDALKKLGLI